MRPWLVSFLSAPALAGGIVASSHAALAPPPIVTGIGPGGGPWISAYDADGRWRQGFLAFFDFSLGGLHVATGDVDGDGKGEIVTSPGWGGRAELRVFEASGARTSPTVDANPFGNGAQIAAGDVTGDGKAELVAADDRGPNVRIFDGATGHRLAFFGVWQGRPGQDELGLRVAAGDVNGDGRADVVTASDEPGDEGRVKVFSGIPSVFFPQPARSFRQSWPQPVRDLQVAAGDVNGDRLADIVVAAEVSSRAEVKVYDAATGATASTFVAFDAVLRGSVRVAAADVTSDGRADVLVAADTPAGPAVRAFTTTGSPLWSVLGVDARESLAAGDLDGDGTAEVVLGGGPGVDPRVVVLRRDGPRTAFDAYEPSFTNGVRVASGDVDGDGTLEYVAGQGPGGSSEVDVFDADANTVVSLRPFPAGPGTGVFVAAGDIDGDRKAEVIAGADSGGKPRVEVFDRRGRQLASFLAFEPTFTGGVRVAACDLDGDGRAEIVAGAGPGAQPLVRVFDGDGRLRTTVTAFVPFFTGGVDVACGDVDGDGRGELVVGAGPGTEPLVRVLGPNGEPRGLFRAYEPEFGGGVHVAVGDTDRDGVGEIVTGPGSGRPVDVDVFTGSGRRLESFRANPAFQGGLFVAMPVPLGPALTAEGLDDFAVEGRAALLRVAAFLDRGATELPDDFAATIDWGDGSTSEGVVTPIGGGRYLVSATQAYRRAGRYTVDVGISDRFFRGIVARATVTVSDAPVRAIGRAIRARAGRALAATTAVLVDGNLLAEPGDYRATVDWGDGTRSRARVRPLRAGRFALVANHRFGRPGTYRVVTRVREAGRLRASARSTATVRR